MPRGLWDVSTTPFPENPQLVFTNLAIFLWKGWWNVLSVLWYVLNNITIEPSTCFTTPTILFRMFKLVEVIGSFSLSTSEGGSYYFRSQPQRYEGRSNPLRRFGEMQPSRVLRNGWWNMPRGLSYVSTTSYKRTLSSFQDPRDPLEMQSSMEKKGSDNWLTVLMDV